jgi:hypothetical protein
MPERAGVLSQLVPGSFGWVCNSPGYENKINVRRESIEPAAMFIDAGQGLSSKSSYVFQLNRITCSCSPPQAGFLT